VVQYTDQLKSGLDLREVWTFGKAKNSVLLPGLELAVQPDGTLRPLPDGVEQIQK